jgi:hypothetical protein
MQKENVEQHQDQSSNRIVSTDESVNRWAKWMHFSIFVAYCIPLLGLAVPLGLWQVKKDSNSFIDTHGKIVANWMINLLIYMIIFLCTYRGITLNLTWIVLGLIAIIYPIIGGIKAGKGEIWEYPLVVKLFK